MKVRVLTQPLDGNRASINLGSELAKLVGSRTPFYKEVWFVSAFADYQSVVRLKEAIEKSIRDRATIHFIIGVDLQSTSIEALELLLTLGADAKIVKNRRPGHTFHPKIYLFESDGSAVLYVGSNNLTEGGMFRNYEGSLMVEFDRRQDATDYSRVKSELAPFISPNPTITQTLTEQLIQTLASRGEILREHQRKEIRRQVRRSSRPGNGVPASPFGPDPIPTPPPLPADFLKAVVKEVERGRIRDVKLPEVTAFYMHLNRLQGPNIPGEARIPLAAREIAKGFWGWPAKYVLDTQTRGTHPRKYYNWKPKWKTWDTASPARTFTDEIRMYEYADSADFRFYAGRLKRMGANEMDIVRITRISKSEGAEFECVLTKRGSQTHSEWERYCTVPITNSPRRFGFA